MIWLYYEIILLLIFSGEAGMLVGIIEQKDPTRNYAGYVNSSESKKKVIQDVFSFGDSAFASGITFSNNIFRVIQISCLVVFEELS